MNWAIITWFSLARLASRLRLAARLFFRRLSQYLSSLLSSETIWKHEGNKQNTKCYKSRGQNSSQMSKIRIRFADNQITNYQSRIDGFRGKKLWFLAWIRSFKNNLSSTVFIKNDKVGFNVTKSSIQLILINYSLMAN